MDPFLYKPIFLHIAVLLSLYSLNSSQEDKLQIPECSNEGQKIFFWSLFFIFFLGLRPVSWAFADTGNYANYYANVPSVGELSYGSDIVFYGIMGWFAQTGFDVSHWFLFIEIIYISGHAFAAYKLFPQGAGIAYAVVLASFSFFSYATNGIRNGMACGLFLIALPYIKEKKWLVAGVLGVLALNVHSSIFLPFLALGLAHTYQNTKHYFIGWLVCIALSLIAGGFFENLIMNDVVADASENAGYFSNENADMSLFSQGGFRYDFLLYSCVPILIGYYFVIKENFQDVWYKIMLNTYIICNSVWVLVNQNWLSNRIAYLSWFMYGYVMMYPLLMNSDVENRNSKIKLAVLGNAGFSYLMWIIGKYM